MPLNHLKNAKRALVLQLFIGVCVIVVGAITKRHISLCGRNYEDYNFIALLFSSELSGWLLVLLGINSFVALTKDEKEQRKPPPLEKGRTESADESR